jgi:hypothetical protein
MSELRGGEGARFASRTTPARAPGSGRHVSVKFHVSLRLAVPRPVHARVVV